MRRPLRVFSLVAGVACVVVVLWLVLHVLPVFPIRNVTVHGNYYLDSDQIVEMAQVPSDATLFNNHSSQIRDNLLADPWITSASVHSVPFGTLSITVREATFDAIVEVPPNASSSSATIWAVSADGLWLGQLGTGTQSMSTLSSSAVSAQASPTPSVTPTPSPSLEPTATPASSPTPTSTAASDASSGQQALTEALSSGIENKPRVVDTATVVPVAGETCDDEGVLAALKLVTELSDDALGEVKSVSAPDAETLTVTLDSGVEVAFGSLTDISTKERVAARIISEHPDSITYVNVRVPDSPAWRGL